MDFNLTEEQRQIRDEIRKVCARSIDSAVIPTPS